MMAESLEYYEYDSVFLDDLKFNSNHIQTSEYTSEWKRFKYYSNSI